MALSEPLGTGLFVGNVVIALLVWLSRGMSQVCVVLVSGGYTSLTSVVYSTVCRVGLAAQCSAVHHFGLRAELLLAYTVSAKR
jgi:hypothetical protein